MYAVKRFLPGQDLQREIEHLVRSENIEAGAIVSGVGSLLCASLRNAGATRVLQLQGPLEIVSMTGTVSVNGNHVHVSVADAEGKVSGGHLMPGCRIASTVELCVAVIPELSFHREADELTGYSELVVRKNASV